MRRYAASSLEASHQRGWGFTGALLGSGDFATSIVQRGIPAADFFF
jgi:hypothetical protein